MYEPAEDDEGTTLVRYADQQLAAIEASLLGLTEEQARSTPCRSALSPGGIVKHVAYVMSQLVGQPTAPEGAELDLQAYAASFALTPLETAQEVLVQFQALRPLYLQVLASIRPDDRALAPPAPWAGIDDARPVRRRYQLVHQIEELARHAGHADIIREQVDGTSVPTLVMTVEGLAANAYFTPYVAAPGTIGS